MIKKIIILFLLIFSIFVLIFSDFGKSQTVIYDCSLSEISPDYPPEVKEECRKLRFEMWLKEQHEAKKRIMI